MKDGKRGWCMGDVKWEGMGVEGDVGLGMLLKG